MHVARYHYEISKNTLFALSFSFDTVSLSNLRAKITPPPKERGKFSVKYGTSARIENPALQLDFVRDLSQSSGMTLLELQAVSIIFLFVSSPSLFRYSSRHNTSPVFNTNTTQGKNFCLHEDYLHCGHSHRLLYPNSLCVCSLVQMDEAVKSPHSFHSQ